MSGMNSAFNRRVSTEKPIVEPSSENSSMTAVMSSQPLLRRRLASAATREDQLLDLLAEGERRFDPPVGARDRGAVGVGGVLTGRDEQGPHPDQYGDDR